MNISEWTSKDNDALYAPVMAHLRKRISEDLGLLEDSEGKTWDNCSLYIMEKARKQAQNGCAVIRDEQVYEWAEDYCRLTDEEYKKLTEKHAKPTPMASVKTSEAPKSEIRIVNPTEVQLSLFGGEVK